MDNLDILKEVKDKLEDSKDKIILISKFNPVPYADKLLEENKFMYDNLKRLWRYNSIEGVWSDDAEMFIRSRLRKKVMEDEQQNKHYVEEVIDYIKGICWNEKNLVAPPINLIPFKDVIFDLDKEDFIPFSPEYFITNKIDIEISSLYTEHDMIDFFLEEIVGNDKKQTLYELMAYCLYKGYPYQKMFILYGSGNNGKSAFLKLLIKFLGQDNVSSRKPQDIVLNKFAGSDLYEKLANISPDIPYTELSDSSLIREMTGDDMLTCEKKYCNSFKFFNYAKIIFSANELPQIRDKNKAFDRRLYIVTFDKEIENPDPTIIDKITTDSQMSGLAWYLLKVLVQLKKRGFVFTNNPKIDEMRVLYEDLSNSLSKFLKDSCIKKPEGKIPVWEFQEQFLAWLDEKRLRQWKSIEINKYMREKYSEGRMNQEMFNKVTNQFETKFLRCWEGLGWK